MPVIVIASTKGGSGKTTTALTIASEIRAAGSSVILLDADREKSLGNWFKDWTRLPGLIIDSDVHEDNIMDKISFHSETTPFVIVDIEGTANMTMIKASSMADLVIIPQKASALDWERTAKTVRAVRDAARMAKREIKIRVAITQTNQVSRSRPTKAIIENLRSKIDTFEQELFDLEAFRAMFLYRMTLDQLETDGRVNTKTARLIATKLLHQIMTVLDTKGS